MGEGDVRHNGQRLGPVRGQRHPSGPGVVWPRLASSGGSYLSLNTPISVGWAMKQHRCAFWSAARWSSADTVPA
jgi:hypothetical protein